MLRAFFGHHKAATTWARNILRESTVALKLDMQVVHSPAVWDGHKSLGDWVEAARPDLIVLTNARIEDVDTLPELRGVHVIRDPRDILVSGYFSHMNSHPEVVDGVPWDDLPPHRQYLREVDEDEGLLAELEFIAPYIDSMSTWRQQPNILELRMEDLTHDPLTAWRPIFAHLQLARPESSWTDFARWGLVRWNLAQRRQTPPALAQLRRFLPAVPIAALPAGYVPEVLDRYSFASLTDGRPVGQEDRHHHYRRGVAGDWRNHLKPIHLKAFRDRFGDLVERLGYEW